MWKKLRRFPVGCCSCLGSCLPLASVSEGLSSSRTPSASKVAKWTAHLEQGPANLGRPFLLSGSGIFEASVRQLQFPASCIHIRERPSRPGGDFRSGESPHKFIFVGCPRYPRFR